MLIVNSYKIDYTVIKIERYYYRNGVWFNNVYISVISVTNRRYYDIYRTGIIVRPISDNILNFITSCICNMNTVYNFIDILTDLSQNGSIRLARIKLIQLQGLHIV